MKRFFYWPIVLLFVVCFLTGCITTAKGPSPIGKGPQGIDEPPNKHELLNKTFATNSANTIHLRNLPGTVIISPGGNNVTVAVHGPKILKDKIIIDLEKRKILVLGNKDVKAGEAELESIEIRIRIPKAMALEVYHAARVISESDLTDVFVMILGDDVIKLKNVEHIEGTVYNQSRLEVTGVTGTINISATGGDVSIFAKDADAALLYAKNDAFIRLAGTLKGDVISLEQDSAIIMFEGTILPTATKSPNVIE